MDKKRDKAITKGETTYTGSPCRVCGNTKRYTLSTACIPCSRKHNRNHRAKLRARFEEAKATREA